MLFSLLTLLPLAVGVVTADKAARAGRRSIPNFQSPEAQTTTTSSMGPVCTLFQGFDSLPAGPLDPTVYYNGIRYEGFSVFDNNGGEGTYFRAPTPVNTLTLAGKSGSMHAMPGQKFSFQFLEFGCSKDDKQQACFLDFTIPGPSNSTTPFFFPYSGVPENELELVGSISGASPFKSAFYFGFSGPDVGKFPGGRKGVNVYLDNLVYVTTGCTV